MFSGREARVQLRFENRLAGPVLDRLGTDAMLIPDGEAHFTVLADVVVSPQFYAWVCGFGDGVQILSPQWAAEGYAEHIRRIAALYEA